MPTPEQRARQDIDSALEAAGWVLQDRAAMNLAAAQGVAVREFRMASGHGFADYLLFVNGKALSDETRAITYGIVKLGAVVQGGVPTLRSSNVRSLCLDLDYVKPVLKARLRRLSEDGPTAGGGLAAPTDADDARMGSHGKAYLRGAFPGW